MTAKACKKGQAKINGKCINNNKIFVIKWTEAHNPDNWGDNEKEAIRNMRKDLPKTNTYRKTSDGWIEFDVTDRFTANNKTEAKKIVSDQYSDLEAFSVFHNKKLSFTEEN